MRNETWDNVWIVFDWKKPVWLWDGTIISQNQILENTGWLKKENLEVVSNNKEKEAHTSTGLYFLWKYSLELFDVH